MRYVKTRSAVVLMLAMGAASSPASASALDWGPEVQVGKFFGGEPILLAATEGASVTPSDGASIRSSTASSVQDTAPVDAPADAIWGGNIPAASVIGNDASTNIGQQSITAGYELGGAGITSPRAPGTGLILTTPTKGRPVRFENGIFIYPSALVGFGQNDNVTGSNSNKVSSSILVLRPEVVAELKHKGDRYTVSYQGNYGRYASSADDDYQHHELWAAGDNYLTTRARIGWGVGYQEKTDPRGSTDRTFAGTPDRWHAPVVRISGAYGAPGSIGRIEVDGSSMQKRYDNNRATTINSDVDLSTISGRFYYRFMPKTSVVVEARNTWANYTLGTSTADNTDLRLYAGFVWEATAKTTGTLKLGRAYKNFDSASREDASMASWEGGVRWSPLTYSTFDLVSSRAPTDATGFGNFIVNSGTSVVWNHRWASYFASRVSAGYIKSDFNSAVSRSDTITNYGFGVFSELGYRMRAGLDLNMTERDSNINAYDMKRGVIMLTLEAVL